MIKTSMDVLSGQTLYKDTFTQYGSLTTYIQVLFLYLFGAKLISLKLGTVAVYSATAVMQFAIGRKYLPLALNIFLYFIWLIIAPFYRIDWAFLSWSSSFALFFQTASTLCFLTALSSKQSRIYCVLSGVFTAAVFWCRIPAGITFAAAYIIIFFSCLILIKNESFKGSAKVILILKNYKHFLLGYFPVMIFFFGLLFFTESLGDWHYQVFEAPKMWLNNSFGTSPSRILWSLFYSPTSGIFITISLFAILISVKFAEKKLPPSKLNLNLVYPLILSSFIVLTFFIFSSISFDIFGGWASAIPIVLLGFFFVTCYGLFYRKSVTSENQIILIWLSIIALSSWHQYFPVTCYRHIFWGVSPALGPFLMICLYIARFRVFPVIVSVGVFMLPMVADRISVAKTNLTSSYVKVNSPTVLSGMLVNRSLFETISTVNETIQNYLSSHPNTPILLDGGDALYNTFSSNLSNPEPMFVSWGYSNKESIAKRETFIKLQKPIIIVQSRPEEKLQEYKTKFNYKVILSVDSMVILVPTN
tara:strand:- start:69627 stop:71219 length:1593 start_codon:yes stop_codon:yes gene_type:complete